MNRRFNTLLNSRTFRITAIIAILGVLSLVGVAVAQSLRVKPAATEKNDPLVEQVRNSPGFPIGIYQDENTPLKITEATVKEISPLDYQKLTGETSDLKAITSVPTARMVNVSDKKITGVMFTIFDPEAEKGKGIYMRETAIAPGQTFEITPENFIKQEDKTKVDESGKTSSITGEPIRNKRSWLPFADKSKLQVRVAVDFEDGTKWFNESQRGEK